MSLTLDPNYHQLKNQTLNSTLFSQLRQDLCSDVFGGNLLSSYSPGFGISMKIPVIPIVLLRWYPTLRPISASCCVHFWLVKTLFFPTAISSDHHFLLPLVTSLEIFSSAFVFSVRTTSIRLQMLTDHTLFLS